MKFKKQDLIDLLGGEESPLTEISNKIVDTSRWSIHHKLIFSFGGKFYQTHYSTGATECQDERPFEYDPDEIGCEEVLPVQKTITVYVPKKVL